MLRESEQINHWLWHERRGGAADDDKAAKLIGRLYDLKRTTTLDRESARDDLNRSAYYHVQPCRCPQCDPRKGL